MLHEDATKNCRSRGILAYSSFATSLTATGTHMPYWITQCYLPPGGGDIYAFNPSQLQLVLDLATPEGCKAELT